MDFGTIEHQFSINLVGSDTGKEYRGDFTYRRLNLRLQAEADKLKSKLNGPNPENLGKVTAFLHEMVSWLKYGIIAGPKWWMIDSSEDPIGDSFIPGYELFDANVVVEVYNAVLKFEESFRKKTYGEEPTKKSSKEKPDKGESKKE